jgi:hypothetical protein
MSTASEQLILIDAEASQKSGRSPKQMLAQEIGFFD